MVQRVDAAMHDDLNSAAALAEISEPLATANRLLASAKGVSKSARWKTLQAFVERMRDVSAMLGLFGDDPEAWLLARRDLKAARVGLDVAHVERLMEERVAARLAKNFSRADELRAELSALEVKIRDTGDGAQWSL
jgi:cysteinyl-tRNA synthetase